MDAVIQETEDTETLTSEIIERIARREGVDPLDLEPPLYEVVDADALNALFASPSHEVERVAFAYAGYEVVVEGPGRIDVDPA